jgi:hypothetical protein
MPDINEAFAALEALDENGRKAVTLSGEMREALLNEATWRAQKAEYLLKRLHEWSTGWGLSFDLAPAAAHWDREHERPVSVHVARYHTLLAERGAEIRDLRTLLDRVLDGRTEEELRAQAARKRLDDLRR